MGKKRGPKPHGKVKIEWSADFAYAIGLIVTDGCLSKDGRHVAFVSKDIEQIKNYMMCLDIHTKIGIHHSCYKNINALHVQFSDVIFYKFLESIGLMSAKSKIIGKVDIPDDYFFDFLRGCLDGDGSFYSYWDSRWRSSHMFYLEFTSASRKHIIWLQKEIIKHLGISGHITNDRMEKVLQLKYAKQEALEIIKRMYYNRDVVCLSRKRLKIEKALEIEREQQLQYTLDKVMPGC